MTTPRPTRPTPFVPTFDSPESQGRKLAIICSKGNLDMAYPGLILANAALGEGVETHLFFTFWGFDMINRKTSGDLKFTMLGNTATHLPQGLGGIPGMTHLATSQMKKAIADLDVPEVPGVPRPDRRLGRPPVGLPDVGGHAAPDRGRPARRRRGDHLGLGLHRADGGRAAALHLSHRGGWVRPVGPVWARPAFTRSPHVAPSLPARPLLGSGT